MITIVLLVSRKEYLTNIITALELMDCREFDTNILCIVDGNDELFIKTRNLINDTKFNKRLTVKAKLTGRPPLMDVTKRRQRIAAIHNEAKQYITHDDGFIFCVEDDTTFQTNALTKLLQVAISNKALGFAIGVEVGRWRAPYIGAFIADDIYNVSKLTSVPNIYPVPADLPPMNIDAGGLYCTLIRTNVYKQHNFTSTNGLGPDVNLGIEARQLGYENFIVWQVQCRHFTQRNGRQIILTPAVDTVQLSFIKESDTVWSTSY